MQKQPKPTQVSYEAIANVSKKAAYQQPVLCVYGAVRNLTTGSATVGNDAGAGKKNTQSDRAAKENVVRIGDHYSGIGLYLFDYKPEFKDSWGHGRQFGVMADEVETVMPEAVSIHPNGYKMVNYALLGISNRIN